MDRCRALSEVNTDRSSEVRRRLSRPLMSESLKDSNRDGGDEGVDGSIGCSLGEEDGSLNLATSCRS